MASRRPVQSLAPSLDYRQPRGWRELPGAPTAIEDEAWKAWARDYLVAMDESPELIDEPATDGVAYPLTLIHEELSALHSAIGSCARVHAYGAGGAMARLYIRAAIEGE